MKPARLHYAFALDTIRSLGYAPDWFLTVDQWRRLERHHYVIRDGERYLFAAPQQPKEKAA